MKKTKIFMAVVLGCFLWGASIMYTLQDGYQSGYMDGAQYGYAYCKYEYQMEVSK